jgi:hypothetical protein
VQALVQALVRALARRQVPQARTGGRTFEDRHPESAHQIVPALQPARPAPTWVKHPGIGMARTADQGMPQRYLARGASACSPVGQMVQPCADSAGQSRLVQCLHR